MDAELEEQLAEHFEGIDEALIQECACTPPSQSSRDADASAQVSSCANSTSSRPTTCMSNGRR